jgi:hypothetical protein
MLLKSKHHPYPKALVSEEGEGFLASAETSNVKSAILTDSNSPDEKMPYSLGFLQFNDNGTVDYHADGRKLRLECR